MFHHLVLLLILNSTINNPIVPNQKKRSAKPILYSFIWGSFSNRRDSEPCLIEGKTRHIAGWKVITVSNPLEKMMCGQCDPQNKSGDP